jgi:hypothetical protein
MVVFFYGLRGPVPLQVEASFPELGIVEGHCAAKALFGTLFVDFVEHASLPGWELASALVH